MKMPIKSIMSLITLAICALAPLEGRCFYNASTGRWLNRDPLGENGFEIPRARRPALRGSGPNAYQFVANQPIALVDGLGLIGGHLEPIPGQPGKVRLVPGEAEYRISRCQIVILVGHTTLMPGKMTVAREDEGFAFGEMYGCLTGGGEEELEPGETVVVSAFQTPGIPGAPPKPHDFIDDDQLVSLADGAFTAAKAQAQTMCAHCVCPRIFITTEVLVGDATLERGRDYDRALIQHLESNSAVIECGK